jgi:NADH:ubiquinone reductase (H+-translocating)
VEKTIIILGAGYAGVLTAKKLARRLKKRDDIKIKIIDKHGYHTMLTELHEVAADRVEEDSIRISLRRIFAGRKVEVVTDTVTAIDYENSSLTCMHGGECHYDYLVMASGSQPAFYGIKGASENTFRLWSYTDAVKIQAHILDVFKRALNATDALEKKRLLTFYVCGAGFTGVEMAGELAEWVPKLCDQFEIERSLVRIINVDLLERVVPALSPQLSAKAQRRLEKMGVQLKLQSNIVAVGEDFIEYTRDGEVFRDETATVIWTAGTEGSDIAKASKQLTQVGRARLKADAYLHAVGFPNVFIAGDNMFYVPAGSKDPVPQMVENCEHASGTIADNLTAQIEGRTELKAYCPRFHGVMVSIGGRYGVAYVGTASHKMALPSFLAMLVKHVINMVYFIQILGWNKVFSYAKHEFFTIRDRRSFLGGHFSNRTPSFLLVPLRVFMGAFWIWEGVKKITDGWLQSAQLQSFFASANDFFSKIITGVDSVGGATSETPAAAGSIIINWNIFGFLKVFVVNASDVAIKIQFSLMDWFTNHVVTASTGSQLIFQGVIVISEILIGALLVGGLLTTAASAYSLALQVMFVMTTGLYLGTWWMIFAAIAVLIGGGSIFGLDYYFMPWLKKAWKKARLIRKLYIYND